jgi:hypothetical protein
MDQYKYTLSKMSIINSIRDFQAQKLQKKISGKYDVGIINPKEFKAKEGQSFFILGSGGSINSLTNNQWSEIEKGFSVGMNKWLIHDFIPDATSLEKNWHIDFYEQLYNDQRLKASKLKFLFYPAGNVRDYQGFPFKVPPSIIAKVRLHCGARHIVNSRGQLDQFHSDPGYIKKIEEKLRKSGLNFEQKGSVYRLVQFALAAGYRHIVFCGIDLNNVTYFWDNNDFLKKRGLESFMLKDQKGKIHATEIKSEESLPMSEVIQSLQNGLKGKVRFETSSSHSKLAEFLSVWNPQK